MIYHAEVYSDNELEMSNSKEQAMDSVDWTGILSAVKLVTNDSLYYHATTSWTLRHMNFRFKILVAIHHYTQRVRAR